jgi:hypothetical protein
MWDLENHSLVKVDPENHIPLMVCTCDCSIGAEVSYLSRSTSILVGVF